MNSSLTDLLLPPSLGRQLLAAYVGWGPGGSFEQALFDRLGLGPIPGRSTLTAADTRARRWQDVPPAGKVVAAAVAWRSWWEQLAGIGEAELLADLADVTFTFGFCGDEEIWGADRAGCGGAAPGRRGAGVLARRAPLVAA